MGRALAQRHYASPVDVVIGVADELCPRNAGRWRLAAQAGAAPAGFRATCERTTAPAHVVLPVWAAGAAYLGGTGLKAMASAGRCGGHAVGLSADSSCSVFWLLAEDGGAELGAVPGAVAERTGLVPWGSR